MMGLRNY